MNFQHIGQGTLAIASLVSSEHGFDDCDVKGIPTDRCI